MLVSVLTVGGYGAIIAGIISFTQLYSRFASDNTIAVYTLIASMAGALSLLWMAQVLDKLDKIHLSINGNKEELSKPKVD